MRALPWLLASLLVACASGSATRRDESGQAPLAAHPRPRPADLQNTKRPDEVVVSEPARPSRRAPGSKPLRLGEVMEILEASPRPYEIRGSQTGRYTNDVWPVGNEPPYWFRIEPVPERGHVVQGFDFDAPSGLKVREAELHFQAGRHAEAAKLYREALASDADFYPAQLNLGDALLFGGDPEAALVEYAKAAVLVPQDHKPWFFAATALLRAERPREALDFYARALSLRPAWPDLLAALENRASQLGVRVMPPVLEPRARAFREGETIVVEGDPSSPAWIGHATCKALWLGEEDLREARTGRKTYRWSHREEAECLMILIEAHLKTRDAHPDAQLDRLFRIAEDGFLHELIIHEVAARIVPLSIQVLAPEIRERLHVYVKRHVLVPLEGNAARTTGE